MGSPQARDAMTEDPQSETPKPSGPTSFWAELKRRKVMRVAITYAVVAWLIIQVASTTFGSFGIPEWAFRFVVIMLCIFFPVAVILAWAFELTPDGIKTTKHAREEQGEVPLSEKQERKRNRFTFLFGAAVPTLIFGALAIFFYFRANPPVTPDQSVGGSSPALSSSNGLQVEDLGKSIAVLPLTNMSPDLENAFFADGVHEEILTNLAKIRKLLVIGRTSTLQYRDTVKPLKQIGSELGVKYLLEGSVQRAGDQVRVTVQLIESESGGHLWAESYTRKLDDFFAIISSISKEISGELQTVLSPEEIAGIERRPTQNQEAYDLYLKGLQADSRSAERFTLLEQAVELDPDFYEAWHRLLVDGAIAFRYNQRSDQALLAKTRYALSQIKRTAPNPSMYLHAQAVLVYNERNDMEGSIGLLLKAAQNPDDYEAQATLAWRYMEMGKMLEALPFLEAAIRADPLDFPIIFRTVSCYQRLGMWEKGRAQIQRNLERRPDLIFWSTLLASHNYLQTGDRDAYVEGLKSLRGSDEGNSYIEAVVATISRDLSRALELVDDAPAQNTYDLRLAHYFDFKFSLRSRESMKALIWFELGNREQWQVAAEKAKVGFKDIVAMDPIADPDFGSNLAICHALTGERDLMEKAISEVRAQTSSANWQYRRGDLTEMHIAICYLVLGDHDKAISVLEAASKMNGPIFLNRELDLWFIFDRLRGDPRFDKLLVD